MGFTYAKLSTSLTESSVWAESSEIRLVWITMLVMADKTGHVDASIPGLAARARVSLESTNEALQKFLAPDPYSRTKAHEGRRIKEVPNGWIVLNYDLYRGLRDVEDRREYTREYMAKRRAEAKKLGKKEKPPRPPKRLTHMQQRATVGLFVPPPAKK